MMKRLVVLQEEQLILTELDRLRVQAVPFEAAPAAVLHSPLPAAAVTDARPVADAPLAAPVFAAPPPSVAAAPAVAAPAAIEPADDEADAAAPAPVEVLGLHAVAKAAALKAERQAITEALALFRWNRRKVAEYLDVSYKTLLTKMKECGISESGTGS